MQTVGHEDIVERIITTAREARPGEFYVKLREATHEFLAAKYTRGELIDLYEEAVAVLDGLDLEEQQEDLLEVMAELEGWCSPHARF